MGDHRTLWQAGRTARVNNAGNVIFFPCNRLKYACRLRRQNFIIVECSGLLLSYTEDNLYGRNLRLDRIDHLDIPVPGNQNLGSGIFENVLGFLPPQPKIKRHDDGPNLFYGVNHFRKLKAVDLKYGYAVARLDPNVGKIRSQPAGTLFHLSKSQTVGPFNDAQYARMIAAGFLDMGRDIHNELLYRASFGNLAKSFS
jgi:hypothetical protein